MIKNDKIVLNSAIWDLHIHTCQCTKGGGEFLKLEVKKYVDKLLLTFKDYPLLEMISFTDHNQISIDVYKEFYSRKSNITLIPGIEIDTKIDNTKHTKHIIFYFNIEEDKLYDFAESLNEYIKTNNEPYIDDLLIFLLEKNIQFVISPHAFKQGSKGIETEWVYPETTPSEAKKYMDQFFCFWEASGKSTIAKAKEFLNDFNLKNKITIISFSDSHDFKTLKNYLSNPPQYFNSLPNFKGIQLVGTDYHRICKNPEKFVDRQKGNYIGSINFVDNEIKLSPKLNVIIGGRGSGKSLLLDSTANSLRKDCFKEGTYDIKRINYIKEFDISVKDYNSNKFIADTLNIDYFNQSYINKIFDSNNSNEALTYYFNNEFKEIKEKNPNTRLTDIKNEFENNLYTYESEELVNISNIVEKFCNITDKKIKLQFSKTKVGFNRINYIPIDEYKNKILNNKNIIPAELKDNIQINKALKDFIKIVYKETKLYNLNLVNNYSLNILNASFKSYMELKNLTLKNKNEIKKTFLNTMKHYEDKYIERVSIINSLLKVCNNYEFEESSCIIKEGQNNSKFKFEKKYIIENPFNYFKKLANKYLKLSKNEIDDYEKLINVFCFKLEENMKKEKDIDNFINDIKKMDLQIEKETNIYFFENNEYKNLNMESPGTKTNLLMEYIVSKKTNIPLLIDQPEDNIDNETIYTKLTQWFRTLKYNRQIIVVTHDANIVINSDAENIIIANKMADNIYNYEYGALESESNLNKIATILDGGVDAVERRLMKYGRN